MPKLISITFLLFSLINCSLQVCQSGQTDNTPRDKSSGARAIPSLSYCALVKAPSLYADKLVRINASWQFGFETTSLYDRDCPDQPKTWLEFADENKLCPETQKNRTAPGKSDKEADVTLVGRLYGPGKYGHLGDYQFKFVVVCMEKIKVTSSDMK
jgi:hypothetical protein